MSKETYRQVGTIQKTHGKSGDLRIHTETDSLLEELAHATVVFVETEGLKMPYFIENIQLKNNPLIKFEDINSMEEAKPLTGQAIFMRTNDLQQQHEIITGGAFAHLYDFVIEDKKLGTIGPIVEVLELPEQIMAVVNYQSKEVMIPLNDTFIQGVDEEEGILLLDLPEGLLEL